MPLYQHTYCDNKNLIRPGHGASGVADTGLLDLFRYQNTSKMANLGRTYGTFPTVLENVAMDCHTL